MTFTTPVALVLLLIIPLLLYIGWPRNRFRRTRDSVSLTLRTLIVTLLILALAGIQIVRSADRLAVVFLVDVSDSMNPQTQEAAFDYIRDALPEMGADDLAGVVVFGADAQVARSMSATRELGPVRSVTDTGNTDIAAAIRLGLALFPEDAARRMVLMSDGIPTTGDTTAAAQLAAAAGVEISYVPFDQPPTAEVQVSEVSVPPVVDEDTEFDLTVSIISLEPTDVVLNVLAGGELVSRGEIELRAGTNTFTQRLRSGAPGFRDFLVQIEPLGEDGFFQNNALGAFTRVVGPSRVLVITTDPGGEEVQHIVPALEESGLVVDVAAPDGLPIGIAPLAQYDSVVLANVPATRLSNQRMRTLETYVSELGGGLVVVGGPESYAPGGYFQTPLEDALPLEMQITDQERLPQLTIAYVVDRSGSMAATVAAGVSYLDLAKDAMIRSIDFLQPTDRAGVASFDFDAFWIADFQEVTDRIELQRLVATLTPGGGTSIMAGMNLVARDIVNEPGDFRHIILLTDGGADPERLVELTESLYENAGVTTSVISIGSLEARFLQEMAQVGGGYYHHVTDPTHIPIIFAQETVLASRTYIQEETFTPALTAIHPIMSGIDALPTLEGYIATSPRAAAQVILRGPEPYSDPLLAAWQYGLGRSVAFTSDATARWAADWVAWDDFAAFWSQAVRWTITEGASAGLETRVVKEDAHARIIVDARDEDGGFLNGLNLETSVVYNPGETSRRVPLRQVAPGRYEGTFRPEGEGAHFLNVVSRDALMPAADSPDAAAPLSQATGWVNGYSAEYDIRETEDGLLQFIAELTNGRDLTGMPAAAFSGDIASRTASVPLWPWLLLIAMLLLPFDVAARRLLISKSDLARARAAIGARFARQTESTGDGPRTERVLSLLQARDRARRTTAPEVDATRTVSALRRSRAESRAEDDVPPATGPRYTPPRQEPQASEPIRGQRPVPEEEAGNIGSRLLKRRRREDASEDGDST